MAAAGTFFFKGREDAICNCVNPQIKARGYRAGVKEGQLRYQLFLMSPKDHVGLKMAEEEVLSRSLVTKKTPKGGGKVEIRLDDLRERSAEMIRLRSLSHTRCGLPDLSDVEGSTGREDDKALH